MPDTTLLVTACAAGPAGGTPPPPGSRWPARGPAGPYRRHGLALLLSALCLTLLAPAAQARRVALLVGNAAYAVGALRHPPQDVTVMRDALLKVGFAPADVVMVKDADQRSLRRSIQDFGRRAAGADVALLYYSGHGTQALGQNWLIPVGADIRTEGDYELEAVSAQTVLTQLGVARPRVGVVVLDACRDNPTAVTKGGTKGLGRMDAGDAMLIAFATAPNDTAADNGLYARVLAEQIQKPGLELLDVFRNTTGEVRRASGGRQVPRVSEVTLDQRVYLAGPAAAPAALPAAVQAAVQATSALAPAAPGTGAAAASPLSVGAMAAPSLAAVDARFPNRPVTLVVPFAAGGPTDRVARDLAQALAPALGQPVVVENLGGAGGLLGMQKVARATADGHTLLLTHLGMATVPALYRKGAVGLADFEPLGLVSEMPLALVVRSGVPVSGPADFASWITASGGRATQANAGLGSVSHLCGLLLSRAYSPAPTAIPYKGTAPAMTDLIGGQVDLICDQSTNVQGQVAGGRVKAVGLASNLRPATGALQGLPVLAESGAPGLDMSNWHGVYAPRGTAPGVVARLNQALRQATASADFRSRQQALGALLVTDGRQHPEGHRQFVQAETQRWGELIRASGQFAD